MGTGCENCRFYCSARISENQRQVIFENYWATEQQMEKWAYIAQYYHTTAPVQPNPNSRVHQSRNYTLDNGSKAIKVCKTMFLDTFGISESALATIEDKKKKNNGFVTGDQRGKHRRRGNQTPEADFRSVVNFIKTLPAVPSHYCRKNTGKDYFLDQGLNVAKMYRSYVENMKNVETEVNPASISTFRSIFNYHFNIGFNQPKKDLCQRCTSFRLMSTEDQEPLQELYNLHEKNKNAVKDIQIKEIEDGRKSKDCIIAVFDMQKVLQLPHTQIGPSYYKRKIKLYNFTVFDMIDHQGFCWLWNETTSDKGTDEIASCILIFIRKMQEKGFREFSFYSDNAGGQNRNSMVFAMFLHLANSEGVNITMRFLEVGHTHNPGDCMHSLIERNSKCVEIYTPGQWYQLIRNAAVKKPYEVQEIQQEEIFDFHELASRLDWKKLEINKVRQIRFFSHFTNSVFVKKIDFSAEEEEIVLEETKKDASETDVWNQEPLQRKLHESLKIDQQKMKDLQGMIKNGDIPKDFKNFYQKIIDNNGTDATAPNVDNNYDEENFDEDPEDNLRQIYNDPSESEHENSF